ncbi:unnamed protein product [Cuscuta europaea]|uniref:DUF7870 domain-containing protein n=1 Tax=Cuscuta europaea TaxID=41803 RepID=A0A9P0VMM7_CUSEU|nr:unnamed protein product [Cuscuta europaea]
MGGYKETGLLFDFQTKHQNKTKGLLHIDHDGLCFAQFLVLPFRHPFLLKVLAHAIVLTLLIVSFPCLNVIGISSSSFNINNTNLSNISSKNPIFHDLAKEGLLKQGDRVLFLAGRNGSNQEAIYKEMGLVSVSDQTLKTPDEETYDVAFANHGSLTGETSDLVKKAVRVGGIIVLQFTGNDNPAVFGLPNTKSVYLRKFKSRVFLAVKKTEDTANAVSRSRGKGRRQLLDTESESKSGVTEDGIRSRISGGFWEQKKNPDQLLPEMESKARSAALKNLEDVLLEPPRAASGKSNAYRKKTRYLPDLMGVSLENYPRRVFIDVSLSGGEKSNTGADWFAKNYPSGNAKFELFKIEAVARAESSSGLEATRGMSDWLRKNVEERDYVVMKTEVEVAEEMVKSRSIRLVDELFLECKHQGIKKGGSGGGEKNRRAYWECLALYGLLRDEGVAVHQWWG